MEKCKEHLLFLPERFQIEGIPGKRSNLRLEKRKRDFWKSNLRLEKTEKATAGLTDGAPRGSKEEAERIRSAYVPDSTPCEKGWKNHQPQKKVGKITGSAEKGWKNAIIEQAEGLHGEEEFFW
ncbi:MAG: hypothetical protein K6F83_00800 [Clostridiales bacterium]|nr:hypothetical protein [Clostridiales bacterium]